MQDHAGTPCQGNHGTLATTTASDLRCPCSRPDRTPAAQHHHCSLAQTDIRYLLIIGAMSRLTVLARKSIQEGSWLARLMHRKPIMLVAIALANKMARAIWAMMTKKEDYRDPARSASA
jgi:hypothetical protein